MQGSESSFGKAFSSFETLENPRFFEYIFFLVRLGDFYTYGDSGREKAIYNSPLHINIYNPLPTDPLNLPLQLPSSQPAACASASDSSIFINIHGVFTVIILASSTAAAVVHIGFPQNNMRDGPSTEGDGDVGSVFDEELFESVV